MIRSARTVRVVRWLCLLMLQNRAFQLDEVLGLQHATVLLALAILKTFAGIFLAA